jgi:hypothetical protein
MFASTVRFVANGWIDAFYLLPEFHFTYLGFGWVQPPPGAWLYVVFAALALFSLAIAAGIFYRFSVFAFFILFTYIELLDKTYYLNHYYFVSLLSFLLIFLPLQRRASVDALWRPEIPSPLVPVWTVAAARLQLGLVYFFAGIAKINTDWLLDAMPLRIWLRANTGFPLIGWLFDFAWMHYLMSWAGMLFDLAIPFLLLYRPTRLWAYVAVIGFHTITGLLFPIGMFPWIMIGCTLVFFSADELGRLGKWLGSVRHGNNQLASRRRGVDERSTPLRTWPGRIVAPLLVIFFAVQIVLPLRHWLYPGNVLWTEEGFRFAWHVMVVEKTGHVTYWAEDIERGITFPLYPSDYLTYQQEKQMSFQPDMILQFAHYLKARLQQQGIENVAIRAEAFVSLNGRRSQLLIDPTVDLTTKTNSMAAKPWILPLANDEDAVRATALTR